VKTTQLATMFDNAEGLKVVVYLQVTLIIAANNSGISHQPVCMYNNCPCINGDL
jgi:hypothetical protein